MFGFRTLQNRTSIQNKNSFNFNMNQQLIGQSNAYNVEQDPYDLNIRPKKIQMIDNEDYTLASKTDDTLKGWLNLDAHFNFLKNMVYTL